MDTEVWNRVHDAHRNRSRLTIYTEDLKVTGRVTMINNEKFKLGALLTVPYDDVIRADIEEAG